MHQGRNMNENEMINSITKENWTYTAYNHNDLQAFISFGADPDILSDNFTYYATVIDSEHNEVFQKDFNEIETACEYLNNKYKGIWSFKNKMTQNDSSGGCSTCIAH